MTESWQNLAIWLAVGGAIVYLMTRFLGWRRRRRACNECRLRDLVADGKTRSRTS